MDTLSLSASSIRPLYVHNDGTAAFDYDNRLKYGQTVYAGRPTDGRSYIVPLQTEPRVTEKPQQHLNQTSGFQSMLLDNTVVGDFGSDLQALRQTIIQDYEYIKGQVTYKVYLTELVNTIFSTNHQLMNILLLDYFDRKFSSEIHSILLSDKMVYFKLRPERKLIEYLDNELDLLNQLEDEVLVLDKQLQSVLQAMDYAIAHQNQEVELQNVSVITSVPPNQLDVSSRYRRSVASLRAVCVQMVSHGLQSARWQENTKERFEQVVELAKTAEEEEYNTRTKHKQSLRVYKDTVARIKSMIKNLYLSRYTKDMTMFKLADRLLRENCEHFRNYFNNYIEHLRERENSLLSLDHKALVKKYYQEVTNTLEAKDLLEYNPEWPPFKEQIQNTEFFKKRGSIKKLVSSFERLLRCFDVVIKKREEGIDQYYFNTLQAVLDKISRMELFITTRLEDLVIGSEGKIKQEAHHLTFVYIEHFEYILARLRTVYQELLCEGPLRKYLDSQFSKSHENQLKSRQLRDMFEQVKIRFDQGNASYQIQEYWSELSLSLFRFSQGFFNETTENNLIYALITLFTEINKEIGLIEDEIITFIQRQMMRGFSDQELPPGRVASSRKFSKKDVLSFLSEDNKQLFSDRIFEQDTMRENDKYELKLDDAFNDTRTRIYALFAANKFQELFKIEPEAPFSKVRFLASGEEFFINIPYYFQVVIEENPVPKRPKFVYSKFPPVDKKKAEAAGGHVHEDEPLKVELDREFKYLNQKPEELKWEQIHTKFFEKLTLEQFINYFVRSRNLLYKGKFYDYMDQILLTLPEGSAVLEEKKAQVSCIEDNMKKGFGYAKYIMKSKRLPPFPIPFSDPEIVTDSEISQYLLSPAHLINIVKNSTTGVPFSDTFKLMMATDITEQSNGVEVKWSFAMHWMKSTMIKGILESQVPVQASKELQKWCEVADVVLKTNPPDSEIPRPEAEKPEVAQADPRDNPVFNKKVAALNAASTQNGRDNTQIEGDHSRLEDWKAQFQFDRAREQAIGWGVDVALDNARKEGDTDWELIPARAKRGRTGVSHAHDMSSSRASWAARRTRSAISTDDDSFDGPEEKDGNQVNILDKSEETRGFIVLGFMVFAVFTKVFFLG